jgi:glycosyltransferase involved in cell wall biosynthesis
MSVPLVSVVMPVRNPGRFLDAAILGIRTQSLTDLN